MTTICPKCRHVRQARDTAPEWQCPACGVAYAKAEASNTVSPQRAVQFTVEPRSMSWTKAIIVVAIVLGAWQVGQIAFQRSGSLTSIGTDSSKAKSSSRVSAAELEQLAATVKADDVVIYTTTSCPYCAQAKSWMTQYGFPFTECDAQVRSECARDLEALGSDGVPYLIVRGKHLKEGFNTDEFIAALR